MENNLNNILQKCKYQKIVIYGLLKKADIWKSLSPNFQIVQMDFEEQQGSIEELRQFRPEAIVLVKQLIARQDIFNQLMEYCCDTGSFLCDLEGRDVTGVCEKAKRLSEEKIDKKQLLDLVKKYDVVSFDIFDTLLMRKVLCPEDVFVLMEKRLQEEGNTIRNFKRKRIAAQEALGLSNPDIFEIYDKFQKKYKISKEQEERCIELEMQVESEVLVPRKEMIDVFLQCVADGKKVSLITDMYIPEELLVPILDKNGIVGYGEIYVSCEEKKLKLQGLFEKYKEEIIGDRYLHIGDHCIHDGICAGLAGMDYVLIPSGYSAARNTAFSKCIELAQTLEEHIMLGMVIAKIYNSPFLTISENGVIQLDKEYDYGYGFFAPFISKFAIWLFFSIKKENVDEILFASRDGYLMQKMYGMIREAYSDISMPKGVYFYTSRKAAVMTGINNEAFINMIIDISLEMPPKKMMRERFGLDAKDILPYQEEKYGDSIHKYVWEHVQAIFKRSNLARKNYYKYMGNIGLNIGKKYAFMDFVSSGTSQKALARMVPFELSGFYAGWNGTEDKETVGVQAMFEQKETFFMRRFKIMETFITSQEPSVSCFDDEGKPVFTYQERTAKELEYVECMQRACIDFFREFLEIVLPEEQEITNEFADQIFACSESAEVCDKEAVLNNLTLMDDWKKKRNHIEQIIQ